MTQQILKVVDWELDGRILVWSAEKIQFEFGDKSYLKKICAKLIQFDVTAKNRIDNFVNENFSEDRFFGWDLDRRN